MKKNSGTTLLELMIAIAVASLIIIPVTNLFKNGILDFFRNIRLKIEYSELIQTADLIGFNSKKSYKILELDKRGIKLWMQDNNKNDIPEPAEIIEYFYSDNKLQIIKFGILTNLNIDKCFFYFDAAPPLAKHLIVKIEKNVAGKKLALDASFNLQKYKKIDL